MSGILSPVANLPLTTSPRGVKILDVKGCKFIDGLRLDPGKFYLMFFSTENQVPLPSSGFYEIADKKEIIFIKEFRPYMRSEYRTITTVEELTMHPDALKQLSRWRVFVFRAFEGDPPLDYVPERNFDYKRANIEHLVQTLKPLDS
jgi:hypothetical protein